MKESLTDLWNRLKADARQDNITKARIAEQTVQHALAGIQEAVTLNPSLPEAEQETPLTENFVLAQYRGSNEKKHAGPATRSTLCTAIFSSRSGSCSNTMIS